MTSAVAMSVRAVAVRVGPAVRVPSATVRGRLAIVPTARRVGPARMATVPMVIVRKATAPRVTVRVRKASGSGRGVISATGRKVIVRKATAPRVIGRVPLAIVRMARRAVIVLMVIARTAIVPASIVRKATAPTVIVPTVTARARSAIVRTARRVATAPTVIVPRAIVLARTAAPVASAAGVVPLSRL